MATAPAHKLGQIIGNFFEDTLGPELEGFCVARGLYLDKNGPRPGVRSSRKVSWEDRFGNTHDLDFVVERDGSAEKRGRPAAFIEAAWRSYTKHSRNKAQEIQGAILPIAEKYAEDNPFLGIALAGVFTDASIEQMRSVGFEVAYFRHETIVAAFATAGIDLHFDEDTGDEELSRRVEAMESLDATAVSQVRRSILERNAAEWSEFLEKLGAKLDRAIDRIFILPLFGDELTARTFAEAREILTQPVVCDPNHKFQRYEISVRFLNGDSIRGVFRERERALEFLANVAA